MFGNLTTIKTSHVEQPLVVSDSSDSDAVYSLDDGPAKRPRYAGPPSPPTTHAHTAPARLLDHQNTSTTGTTGLSTPEKVEIPMPDESIVSVPPFTPKDPATIKVEITDASSHPDHPSRTSLRPNEDPADDSDNTGAPTLLRPPGLQPPSPRFDSHVGRQNRLMFNSL